MQKRSHPSLTPRVEILIVLLLLILGGTLRCLWLDSLPMGLNQDEASTGYEAWSIYHYGIDRNGYEKPVLLYSWGSGQNALYTYLAMPFIATFGLSVWSLRLVAAIFGTLTLVIFWLLARYIRGPKFALCALLFLTINPWHIMISRWALESNLLPFFLLAGVYFMTLFFEKDWALIPAALCFSLSLYAYGTAFFFLPVFLCITLVWISRHRTLKNWKTILSCCLFLAVALPITLTHLRNAMHLEGTDLLGFSLPALGQGRQLDTSVLGGGGLTQMLLNYKNFLTLLWKQTDLLPFQIMEGYGLYYFFGLPLILIGLISALAQWKDHPRERPILFALLSSVLCALLIDINTNRINMVFLPLLYFGALGLWVLLRPLKKLCFIPVVGLLLCCGMFFTTYVQNFKTEPNSYYFPGLGDAISYAQAQQPEKIYITNYVEQPYIFALFYTQTPPDDFRSTVQYRNPGSAFEYVDAFGMFQFGTIENTDADILILNQWETEGYPVLMQFGSYAVCENNYTSTVHG